LRAYLSAIVNNAERALFKKRGGLPPDPDPDSPSPEKPYVLMAIRILRRRGKAKCAYLFERYFFEGATYAELAAELQMEESSVRGLMSRCLKVVKTVVAP